MSRFTRLHDRQLEAEAYDWLDYFLVGLLLGTLIVAAVAIDKEYLYALLQIP